MARILGVDGGNSKTMALLADETGRVLGRGRAGGSNHQGVGIEAAMAVIRTAADEALHQAGLGPEAVDAACFALAGADLPSDFALLEPAITQLGLAHRSQLNNDTFAALRSGTDNPNAVVVVLGAGTNAAGRNAAGEEIRLAGLDWKSGDWGGGMALAHESVRLAVRAWDGRGSSTMLERTVPAALGCTSVPELIEGLYHRRIVGAQLLELPRILFQAADAGDEPARDLVRSAGEEVGVTAETLLRRLNLLNTRAEVVLGGSLFRSQNETLLTAVADVIGQAAPDASLSIPDLEPVAGSVLCAMDLLGLPAGEDVKQRLGEV